MSVLLSISELIIDFDTRFPKYVRRRCAKYLADAGGVGDAPALRISASEDDLRRANAGQVGEPEAELYAMTITLNELLPSLDRLMMHGVAIECDGKGFIFTAESGVGKSTHAQLWQNYLGEGRVLVINGDKPILWFREDGEILVCGTPWNGKENLDENRCLPLHGICLLKRLAECPGENIPSITQASREDAFEFLLHQIFLPTNSEAQLKTFRLIEKLYENVPVYHLVTDMSREGVMISSGCLLG